MGMVGLQPSRVSVVGGARTRLFGPLHPIRPETATACPMLIPSRPLLPACTACSAASVTSGGPSTPSCVTAWHRWHGVRVPSRLRSALRVLHSIVAGPAAEIPRRRLPARLPPSMARDKVGAWTVQRRTWRSGSGMRGWPARLLPMQHVAPSAAAPTAAAARMRGAVETGLVHGITRALAMPGRHAVGSTVRGARGVACGGSRRLPPRLLAMDPGTAGLPSGTATSNRRTASQAAPIEPARRRGRILRRPAARRCGGGTRTPCSSISKRWGWSPRRCRSRTPRCVPDSWQLHGGGTRTCSPAAVRGRSMPNSKPCRQPTKRCCPWLGSRVRRACFRPQCTACHASRQSHG